jgi:hypothetical protein
MKSTNDCPLCDEPLEDAPAIHDPVKCEKTELLKAREKIKKLTASINDWKDGWFHLRDIIGRLSWEHRNCPHEIKPAPDPTSNSWLHPNETIVQEGKLVYKKEGTEWKLVGASTSEDGAKAVVRLLQMEATHEGYPGNAEGSVRGREAGSSSPDTRIRSSHSPPDVLLQQPDGTPQKG